MAQDEVIVLGGDDLEDIEYDILVKRFGKEEADKLTNRADSETDEPFDAEVQDVIDSTPALDEM